MIDRAGNFNLGVFVGVLSEQGQGFAIEQGFDVYEAARARGTDLVRTVERHRAGTRKRKLLLIIGYDLERRVVVERYRFLCIQIVRHRLEQSLGLCRVGESNKLDPAVESTPFSRVVGGDRPLFAGAGRGQPLLFDAAFDQPRLDGVGAFERQGLVVLRISRGVGMANDFKCQSGKFLSVVAMSSRNDFASAGTVDWSLAKRRP